MERFVILSTTAFCLLGDVDNGELNETNVEKDRVRFRADFDHCNGHGPTFEILTFSSESSTLLFAISNCLAFLSLVLLLQSSSAFGQGDVLQNQLMADGR